MILSKEQRESAEEKIKRSGNFQRLFSGKDGKKVLGEIDKFTMYKGNTFNQDPYVSAYNAGQRSMSVFLHNIIDQDLETARKLLKENKSDGTKKM